MGSHYYPSIVAFIDGISGQMEPREVSGRFVLRNPYPTEVENINDIISSKYSYLPQLDSEYCLLEVSESIPTDEVTTMEEHCENVRIYGPKLIMRALTFLRLYQFGNLGIVYLWVPLSVMGSRAFTFLDTYRWLMPPVWPYYTDGYVLPKDLSDLEPLVDQFWNQSIEEDKTVRLFNK